MPFPFGKSHKSPADIVKNLKDSMTVLEKHDISDKKAEKVGEGGRRPAPGGGREWEEPQAASV